MAPVGSVLAALPCVVAATWGDGVLRGAAALGAAAGGTIAAGGAEGGTAAAGAGGAARFARGATVSAVPDLATPPCPRHAPRPAFELAPSLHVTVAAAPAVASAADGALFADPAVADLSTPPCPRHAPRPPAAVVPSLQVTVAAVAWTSPAESKPAMTSAEAMLRLFMFSS